MIPWSPTLQNSSPGKTGIATAHLLDVQDVNGNCYYWGSRKIVAPSVITASGNAANNEYAPWIMSVPQITVNRSMQTSMVSIQMQNLSGTTLERDFSAIVRRSALEGGIAVHREWNAGAQEAEFEFHALVSVDESNPTKVNLLLKQINNPSQDIAPARVLCEICQWRWSSIQCGSTQTAPCQQTYGTCQVLGRIFAIINPYEKNYGEAWANVPTTQMNRVRQF